ncbi:MAG: glutamine--fructose-6-phosphate transaminase (isomerizing) [Candidatus Diapherotrites archaeon]|nr:glutamine--fructose-6-phosphate transaminase (isomerizing) [Candidatus Diapherotrites archaeon]
MCGIIGYKGDKNAIDIVFQGIKRLEYRGYDSWGIATVDDQGMQIAKTVGRIQSVPEALEGVDSTIAISHSRWATHGGVTQENAHPHTSCDGGIAIVHNGIIENHKELRRELESKGHTFKSECDSEVIAHLIEEEQGRGFEEAVRHAALKLKGSYAFLAISKDSPLLIGVRHESPLVIGFKDGETFVASDVPAFLEHTNKVMFLDDGEMVVTNSEVKVISTSTGEKVEKETRTVDWDITQATKGNYAHFMLKEIHEQPVELLHTLMQDKKKLEQVARRVHQAPRVCIIACGTSRHASLVGRYVISEISGKYCEVYNASEFQYFVDKLGKDTLIIAVSQSGETADVLGPVRMCKEKGCKVISLVNVVGSSLDRESDVTLHLNCGPEISVASTKAFTAQVTMFYLLAYTMGYAYEDGYNRLREIPLHIDYTIKNTEPAIRALADKLKDKESAYYIARGENFAVATEGALKMKEISYVHAEGMPAGELKHGTLALIEKGTPVIVICPKDQTYGETLANASEAKARGAFIIGISDENNELFDAWLEIPNVDYLFYPLLANIPCQLLAYYTAVAKGTDVDKPRNLAKSVTVK